RKIGFSRVVVGTVKEALAALEKQKFDLVFLDLKLPDGPADDVYDAIKQDQPYCPIIIITGYPDSAMPDRILTKGPLTVLKNRIRPRCCGHGKRSPGRSAKTKIRSRVSRFKTAGRSGGRRLRCDQARPAVLSDYHHHRLSGQRDARPNFDERTHHGFEKAAQS